MMASTPVFEQSHSRGLLFYFTAPHSEGGHAHFWRYYNSATRDQLEQPLPDHAAYCLWARETPRFPPPYDEVDIYDLQERIIADILGNIEQQHAAAVVSKPVAEEQTIASTSYSNI